MIDSLKVSAYVKIYVECFENFGGENAPSPWLRACCTLTM